MPVPILNGIFGIVALGFSEIPLKLFKKFYLINILEMEIELR
jgi:hypothetical protein